MTKKNPYKSVKKNKYRKVVFKLSDKQKKVIDRYCDSHRTTPNKFYKTAIRTFLANFSSLSPEDEYYISENQLKLFDDEEDFVEIPLVAEDGL